MVLLVKIQGPRVQALLDQCSEIERVLSETGEKMGLSAASKTCGAAVRFGGRVVWLSRGPLFGPISLPHGCSVLFLNFSKAVSGRPGRPGFRRGGLGAATCSRRLVSCRALIAIAISAPWRAIEFNLP